jgi:hypothetical protein
VTEHQPHFAFVGVPIMVEQQAALREVAEARGIIAPGQTSELFRGRARGVPDLLYEVVADFLEANTEELDKITTARERAERAELASYSLSCQPNGPNSRSAQAGQNIRTLVSRSSSSSSPAR